MRLWMMAAVFLLLACAAALFVTLLCKNRRALLLAVSAAIILNLPALSGFWGPGAALSARAGETETAEQYDFGLIDLYIKEVIGIIDAAPQPLSRVSYSYEPRLEYEGLSPEDKAMYDEMLENVRRLAPFFFTAKQHGHGYMNKALNIYGAIKDDHPEIEIYYMLRDVVEGNQTTALEAYYFMPWDQELSAMDEPEKLRWELQRFEAVCDRIVERMPEEYSTYDKYRYLASVISLVTFYDMMGGWQVGTAYGSIMGGHSICQGYSRGFLYLCQKADLWCETVEGISGGNNSHMWNMVKLDSGTYYLDITWSDNWGYPDTPDWHRYFMITQGELVIDHEITDGHAATGTPLDLVGNQP